MVTAALLDLFEELPWRRRRHEAWAEVARRRGGVYHRPRGGLFGRTRPLLEVPFGPFGVVPVSATLERQKRGEDRVTLTVTRAPYLLGRGPVFRLTPLTTFGRLARALRSADLRLQHPTLDGTHRLQATDPARVRAFFGAEARDALARVPGGAVYSDGAALRCVLPQVAEDPSTVELALAIVGVPAAAGSEWLPLLARLPGRPTGPGPGAPPFADLELSGSRVRATPATAEGSELAAGPSALSLVAPAAGPLPDARLHVTGQGDLHGSPPAGLLDAAQLQALIRLGPVVVAVEGGVVKARLPGPPREAVVTAAATWVAELAGGKRRVGAFR